MEDSESALREQIARHRPMLVAYARALVNGDPHCADEVVQESLLISIQKLQDFEMQRDLGRWLRGIVRLKVLEVARGNRRMKSMEDPDVLEGIEETFVAFDLPDSAETGHSNWLDEAREQLQRCLGKLAAGLRQVVEQVYVSGRAVREAAAIVGISEDAAARRLSRARDELRQCVHWHRNAGV